MTLRRGRASLAHPLFDRILGRSGDRTSILAYFCLNLGLP
jgi:hypothetical protein